MQRLHIGIEATAIVKALGASFDGKEITMSDLVGDAPGEDAKSDIEEWKQAADKKGLKA